MRRRWGARRSERGGTGDGSSNQCREMEHERNGKGTEREGEGKRKTERERERMKEPENFLHLWHAADEERRGERSWSGRSPANRRTRGGPVRPHRRNLSLSLSRPLSLSLSLVSSPRMPGYCTLLLAVNFPLARRTERMDDEFTTTMEPRRWKVFNVSIERRWSSRNSRDGLAQG